MKTFYINKQAASDARTFVFEHSDEENIELLAKLLTGFLVDECESDSYNQVFKREFERLMREAK